MGPLGRRAAPGHLSVSPTPLLLGSLVPSVTQTVSWGQLQREVRSQGSRGGPGVASGTVRPLSQVRGSGLSHRRMGCCCKGYAWVSPCKRNLQFCVYW